MITVPKLVHVPSTHTVPTMEGGSTNKESHQFETVEEIRGFLRMGEAGMKPITETGRNKMTTLEKDRALLEDLFKTRSEIISNSLHFAYETDLQVTWNST